MKFYKFMHYSTSVSIGLLALILFEGMVTLGAAFDFEHYTAFGWFVQALFVIMTINLSLIASMRLQEED